MLNSKLIDLETPSERFTIEARKEFQTGFYHTYIVGYTTTQAASAVVSLPHVLKLAKLDVLLTQTERFSAKFIGQVKILVSGNKISWELAEILVRYEEEITSPILDFVRSSWKRIPDDEILSWVESSRKNINTLDDHFRRIEGMDLDKFTPVGTPPNIKPNIGTMTYKGNKLYFSPNGYRSMNKGGQLVDATLDNRLQEVLYRVERSILSEEDKLHQAIPDTKITDGVLVGTERKSGLVLEDMVHDATPNLIGKNGIKILSPLQQNLVKRRIVFHLVHGVEDANLENILMGVDKKLVFIDLSGGKRKPMTFFEDSVNEATIESLLEQGTHIKPSGKPDLNPQFLELSNEWKKALDLDDLVEQEKILDLLKPEIEKYASLDISDVRWTIMQDGISATHLKQLDTYLETIYGPNGRAKKLLNSLREEYSRINFLKRVGVSGT